MDKDKEMTLVDGRKNNKAIKELISVLLRGDEVVIFQYKEGKEYYDYVEDDEVDNIVAEMVHGEDGSNTKRSVSCCEDVVDILENNRYFYFDHTKYLIMCDVEQMSFEKE